MSGSGGVAHGLSCSRRLSPLSGRNSTYRPVQISGTGSLVVAVGLRATRCRMRPVADRLLAQMLVLFAGIWTGCSLTAGIFWRRYLRWWLTRIAIVRTLLTVALIFVTVTPGAPALGGPAAFAAGPAHDVVRSEAQVRTVHDLSAERRWGQRFWVAPFPTRRRSSPAISLVRSAV